MVGVVKPVGGLNPTIHIVHGTTPGSIPVIIPGVHTGDPKGLVSLKKY